MTTVTVSEDIKGKAADVWAALSDFGGIKVGGADHVVRDERQGRRHGAHHRHGLADCRRAPRSPRPEGDGVRVFDHQRRLSAAGEGLSATVKITDKGDGTCNVNWSGTFEPKGDAAAASKVVEGIYKGGIAGARRAVGG